MSNQSTSSSSRSSGNRGRSEGKSTATSKHSPSITAFNSGSYLKPREKKLREDAAAAAASAAAASNQAVPAPHEFPSLRDSIGSGKKQQSNGSGKKKESTKTVIPSATGSSRSSSFDLVAALKDDLDRNKKVWAKMVDADRAQVFNMMADEAYAALVEEDDPLKIKCLQLLLTHDKRGEKSFYQYRAFQMVPSGYYTFKIDFEHLLQEEYLDLAIEVWKDYKATHSFGYLRPIVVNFLKMQGLFHTEQQLQIADLDYDNLPSKMQQFSKYTTEDLVKEDESAFGREHSLISTRYLGRQIQISAHTYVHELHSAGRTLGGQFTAENIYIIEFNRQKIWCRIQAEFVVFSYQNIVLDIKGIHKSMAGSFKINGNSPPHFDCLESDVNSLTPVSATQTSILGYFPYHVAFMPDGANKKMTEELYNVTQGVWMDDEVFSAYKSVFESVYRADWRPAFSSSSDHRLRGVYNHDNSTVQILEQDQKLQAQVAVGQPLQSQPQLQSQVFQVQPPLPLPQPQVAQPPRPQVSKVQPPQPQVSVSQVQLPQQLPQVAEVLPQVQQQIPGFQVQLPQQLPQVSEVLPQVQQQIPGFQVQPPLPLPQPQVSQIQPPQPQVSQVQLPQVSQVQLPQQLPQVAEVLPQVQQQIPGVKPNKFKRTLKGKLMFKRHLTVHLHEYMDGGQRPFMGLFQAELYAASKNNVLGEFFSELHKGKTMKLKGHLWPLVTLYHGMRDADDEAQPS